MNSLRGAIGRRVPLTSLPEASILRPCPTILTRLGAAPFSTTTAIHARPGRDDDRGDRKPERPERKKDMCNSPLNRPESVELNDAEIDPRSVLDGAPRIPLSVQAVYYKPLRREQTHGLPVCNLQIRSYSVRNLEMQADIALRAAYYLGLPASGPVPLPRKIERWTVPRGNFVHKKSQENFERITLTRLIQIKDGHPDTVQIWLAFVRKHAFYGVGMKASVWEWEELGVGKRMDKVLEDVEQVPYPKWQNYGQGTQMDTASMVKEILQSEEYRVLENEK